MKNILIATDFSKGAENAAGYARNLARMTSGRLTYLHIVTLPVVDPMVTTTFVNDTIDDLKAEAEDRLKRIVEEDKGQGLAADYIISFEDIISTINEAEDADLVVIGKTGHRTFLDRLIGSTAQNLINHIAPPLLVIPEDFSGDLFGQLCYASQMEFNEKIYLAQALNWRKYSDADLIIGHIIEDFPLDINANEQYMASIDRDFQNKGYVYKNFAADVYKKGIAEFIEKEGISLLFVTARKRGFFEGIIDPSQTRKMINDTKIPVVVFNYTE
ncbi:universal stress protein [Leadbetterella sp. DM7]|uniref:universal stress protein n=1 Tax=Leadbetterella sp. DM7 TaxID=3235085 RepID=UPI00349E98B8